MSRSTSRADDVADEEAQGWIEEQRQLDARGAFYAAVTQVCVAARKTTG